jgi:hypothetical protein
VVLRYDSAIEVAHAIGFIGAVKRKMKATTEAQRTQRRQGEDDFMFTFPFQLCDSLCALRLCGEVFCSAEFVSGGEK